MNNSNVIGSVYSSEHFSYDSETKSFTGFISDTQGVLRQLWNNSLDTGFGIQSFKTGRTVYFVCSAVNRNFENDILSWTFEVFNPRNKVVLLGLTTTIFNT